MEIVIENPQEREIEHREITKEVVPVPEQSEEYSYTYSDSTASFETRPQEQSSFPPYFSGTAIPIKVSDGTKGEVKTSLFKYIGSYTSKKWKEGSEEKAHILEFPNEEGVLKRFVALEKDITILKESSKLEYEVLVKSLRKKSLDEMCEELKKFEKRDDSKNVFMANELPTQERLYNMILGGFRNIWMVGPAGCGKTTIAKNVAKELDLPYYILSCGIGTSATDFIGYKYPEREKTMFSDFYSKPSIIILDEFTALDPSVAQVANSALANGVLMTTTGLVERHSDCIIIATSNTFGTGSNRQYVSNNQLDASTLDRFVGGILEVDYDPVYESRFDEEVVIFVNIIRRVIKDNVLRRIASTRMIIEGEKLKKMGVLDWKQVLLTGWSNNELQMIPEEALTKFTYKFNPLELYNFSKN